jgi:multiple sugar transport system permease protein
VAVGLAFLLPNILGFLAFTLLPIALSFGMAFTDWDIQRHNLFRWEPLAFVGFENFARLFGHAQFWHYLGNTFFLMLGLPFAIAGSLCAALLLAHVSRRRASVRPALALATVVFMASAMVLLLGGMAESGVWFLFGTLLASVLAVGVLTRGTVYRTLFYLPHFTAGVATFVLWKKLYNIQSGPINAGLAPLLDGMASVIRAAPTLFAQGVPILSATVALIMAAWQVRRLRRAWDEAEAGIAAVVAGSLTLAVPVALYLHWLGIHDLVAIGGPLAIAGLLVWSTAHRPRPTFPTRPADVGLGTEVAGALLLLPVLALMARGLAVGRSLPDLAAAGFEPPNWLGDYAWAKPALMIMAFWAAIGSNNMILYLAGLSNIPPELYEAADIDGASRAQRFWSITWPQLAPITFFVAVMGVIHGLQGGFEMARTMTLGGPAGATTTLSYFIYIEGFETGRLGYASAVAWVLFALVFVLSALNFRFANRNVND